MRIKKYQKIICLGLALLSIMVLPCYANNDDIGLGYFVDTLLFEYESENKPLYNIPNEKFINTYLIKDDTRAVLFTKNLNYSYYTLVICLLEYNSSNSYYLNLGKRDNSTADYLLYPIKKEDSFLTGSDVPAYYLIFSVPKSAFKIYTYPSYVGGDSVYFTDVILYYNDNISGITIPVFENSDKIGQISIFSPTFITINNIATYTNVLIQNCGKAFTFMTGSALPWVLLGITISLITYGIHTSKRIL